jgi:hypothetical protein
MFKSISEPLFDVNKDVRSDMPLQTKTGRASARTTALLRPARQERKRIDPSLLTSFRKKLLVFLRRPGTAILKVLYETLSHRKEVCMTVLTADFLMRYNFN